MTNPLKLLLIEDSEDDALLILVELQNSGFNLDWERIQTAEALNNALAQQPWDVLISDYRLPGFDAPAALKILKQINLDLPFIVVSGTMGETLAVELMKAGAHDYLMKNNLARLPEAVRREVREAQTRAAHRQATLELHQTQERLQLAIDGSGIGLWDWFIESGVLTLNEQFAQILGYSLQDLQPPNIQRLLELTHPEDIPKLNIALERHFRKETQVYECELRKRHKSGLWVWGLSKGKVVEWSTEGKPLRMTGTLLDISVRKQAELRSALQNSILEKIAKAEPLPDILDALACAAEGQLEGGLCSILLAAEDQLYCGAAPHLPDTYTQALGRLSIGEGICSCGTAAFRREAVIVSDIATDPLWKNYKELALTHGLRSCWSVPVIDSHGLVLATVALYHQAVYTPQAREIESVILLANIAKIAIERQNATHALETLNQDLENRVAQRTAAVQRSETRLREAQQVARLGNWELEVPTLKLTWSDETFRIFGLPPRQPEPSYGELLHYFPPKDRARLTQFIDQAIQQETSQETDLEIIRGDGSSGHVFIKTEPRRYPQGQVTRLFGILMDISDRKQAEETIRQQAVRETILREITQRIRQSLDLQTIFDTACQEIRQVMQADRVSIFKFLPTSRFEEGEFVADSVTQGYDSVVGLRVHDHCFGTKHADLYAQGRFYVIDDIYSSGMPECHTDILEQFQVRASLVVSLLCKNTLWGLLCIHQCQAPRHWQQSEIDLTHQLANQLDIAIQQANLVEQLQNELTERLTAEAKLTDINQQLAISNVELARATRLKDEFLANMSHELRTPLNAILGMSEGLQEEVFGTLNDRQKRTIATIERSGQHLLELINDILDVSKIAAGKLELDISTVSVTHLCNSSLAFVKELANKKRIQLHTNIPSHLDTITVDERRMRQVLINLLTNAVKFTPDGGQITLEVYLESIGLSRTEPIALRDEPFAQALPHQPAEDACLVPDHLYISVTDTGIGIDATHQSKLFQPFIQLDSNLNRKYEGTGLGLALVKQIVELHGGSVSLKSETGQGSCFTLCLPHRSSCAQGSAPHTARQSSNVSAIGVSNATTPTPLILLAEDNAANISTISGYLEAKHFRILLAQNGSKTLELARVHRPDLIVMDIQMPEMDGLETTQHLRHDPNLANIPIIALTALAMPGDRERCLAAGANVYLTKPVRLKELANHIQQLLALSIAAT